MHVGAISCWRKRVHYAYTEINTQFCKAEQARQAYSMPLDTAHRVGY